MKTKFVIVITIFLTTIMTQVFSNQQLKKPRYGEVIFLKQQLAIKVEIAQSDAERSIGLMFRENLAERNGMLFVNEQEKKLAIWMKNTLIPLDIVFVSAQGVIVSIFKDLQPCLKVPCQIYESQEMAKYILEINAGLAEKNGVRVGQRLKFNLSQIQRHKNLSK